MKSPKRIRTARQLSRAYDFLLQRIEECRECGEHRLPTVASMGSACGVSHVTMQHAVTRAVGEKRIESRRGSGIYLHGHSRPPGEERESPSESAWQRASARLETDILSSRFRRGRRLPTRKELCAWYGVSHRTINRALQWLASRGVLARDGVGYRVSRGRRVEESGFVVVHRAGTVRGTALPDTRHLRNVLDLENVCVRSRLGIRTTFYTYRGSSMYPQGPFGGPPYRSRDLSDVLGFVVFTRGLTDLGTHEHVSLLAGYGKPVAVLDEEGVCTRMAEERRYPSHVRVFPQGMSEQAGRVVGEYLITLGHRQVVYIDPFPDIEWSTRRLAGLRRAYGQAGPDWHVVHVPVPMPPGAAGCDRQGRSLDRIMADLSGGLDPDDPVHRQLRAVITNPSGQPMGENLFRSVVSEALHEALGPTVGRVLRTHAELTAFVGPNDEAAVGLVRSLEKLGHEVPHSFSVIGFDDSFEAQAYDLTSYSFNESAAMQAMVDFILNPRWGPFERRDRSQVVELDGFVKKRRTTAVCRARHR